MIRLVVALAPVWLALLPPLFTHGTCSNVQTFMNPVPANRGQSLSRKHGHQDSPHLCTRLAAT